MAIEVFIEGTQCLAAKQFQRARKILRSLTTITGRVMRDVERKIDAAVSQKHKGTLILSDMILTQKHTTRGILCSRA